MAKVGKVFKAFFKVIFTTCALVAGALVFIFLGLDFLTGTVKALGLSGTVYATGYALAFKGPLMLFATNGNDSSVNEINGSNLSCSVGILIGFILLCLALVLAIIYLVCAWGHKCSGFKKFFAYGSSLCFLVCGILFFCALPLGKSSLLSYFKVESIVNTFEIGSGAICSGVFSICAAIFALIAGALGPKK